MKVITGLFTLLVVSSISFADDAVKPETKEGQPCVTAENEQGIWVKDGDVLKCAYSKGLSKETAKPTAGEPCVTKDRSSGKWARIGKQLICK